MNINNSMWRQCDIYLLFYWLSVGTNISYFGKLTSVYFQYLPAETDFDFVFTFWNHEKCNQIGTRMLSIEIWKQLVFLYGETNHRLLSVELQLNMSWYWKTHIVINAKWKRQTWTKDRVEMLALRFENICFFFMVKPITACYALNYNWICPKNIGKRTS